MGATLVVARVEPVEAAGRRDGPGGRGWSPTPGSRRSGRARLGHPAPRTMASLRANARTRAPPFPTTLPATCRTCVETADLARWPSPSVRPAVHDPIRRFPPPGPRGASSPTSSVLSADSDFSTPVPPHFVFLRLAVPLGCPVRSRGSGPLTAGRDCCLSRPSVPRAPVETSRPPRFLGDPCLQAPLSDPGGTASRQTISARRWCLPLLSQRRLPRCLRISWLNHAACKAPCVRFAAGVTPGPRNTRFRLAGQPWPVRTLTCWVA